MRDSRPPSFVCLLPALLLLAGCASSSAARGIAAREPGSNLATSAPATSATHRLTVGSLAREYRLHLPPTYDAVKAWPVVLVLHGGGGAAENIERWSGFDALADRAGFITVYPQGYKNHWIDGRNAAFQNVAGVDDVAFIRAVLDDVGQQCHVDARRVYACGVSNGAMMAQRLGLELSDRLAAIGTIAGSMPVPLEKAPLPHGPVAVISFHGTKDALVPFAGGSIIADRGRVLGARESARRWAQLDGCAAEPKVESLPDRAPHDGTRVTRETYAGRGTDVVLYVIEGGGHTWPGVSAPNVALPGQRGQRAAVVTHDVDATPLIWEFFEKHAK